MWPRVSEKDAGEPNFGWRLIYAYMLVNQLSDGGQLKAIQCPWEKQLIKHV